MDKKQVDKENLKTKQVENAKLGKLMRSATGRSPLCTVNGFSNFQTNRFKVTNRSEVACTNQLRPFSKRVSAKFPLIKRGKNVEVSFDQSQFANETQLSFNRSRSSGDLFELEHSQIKKSANSSPRGILHPRLQALQRSAGFQETPDDEVQKPPSPQNMKIQHANAQLNKNIKIIPVNLDLHIEYGEDFVELIREKDLELKLRFGFGDICLNSTQWAVVFNYIMNIQTDNGYPSSNLYLTMKIFYSFLQRKKVSLNEVQIISLACMWISLKKDAHILQIPKAPELIKYIDVTDTQAAKTALINAELKILQTLDFNISFIDVTSIVSYFLMTQKMPDMKDIYYVTCYMIDLLLFDSETCTFSPLFLAAAAVEIGALIIDPELSLMEIMEQARNCFNINNSAASHRTCVLREKIIKMAIESLNKISAYNDVYRKYVQIRYGGVSSKIKNRIFTVADVVLKL